MQEVEAQGGGTNVSLVAMMQHALVAPEYPALALRATVAAALLATASIAHAEGGDAPDPAPAASDSPVRAMFSAEHPRRGRELWITDGTRRGTHLLPDETTRVIPVAPSDFTAFGDGRTLFTARTCSKFTARTGSNNQLWITNGRARGTRIVREIDSAVRPRQLRALGDGRAVFLQRSNGAPLTDYTLWVTDGTRRGTSRVQQFPNLDYLGIDVHASLTSMGNGLALFAYDNGRTGVEPWVTDGTRAGTHLLRNIHRSDGSMRRTRGEGFTPFTPTQP